MATPVKDLFKITLYGKSSKRFLIACLASFAFSIAVILGTIGIMDGFEETLKKSLLKSNGDITLVSRDGFFFFDSRLKEEISTEDTLYSSALIQTQGFVIHNENSKGVLIKGIEPKSYEQVTSLELGNLGSGVAIGSVLAKKLDLAIGNQITVALAKGNDNVHSLPKLIVFTVEKIVSHGIYEKDLRFIYLEKDHLAEILNLTNRSNIITLKLKNSDKDLINKNITILYDRLGERFKVKAYWAEFFGLLKAVEIEKLTISLVLQIIVLISVFNIAAFIIYISEKKSQDLFLIQAIGASPVIIKQFWYYLIISLWILSCALSVGLVQLFNYMLKNVAVFQIPGDIYVLSNLKISLTMNDYLLVFVITLTWMILVGYFSIKRMSKKNLLSGLRQEFS